MTIIVQPKGLRFGETDSVRTVVSAGDELWLDCEVVSPPSAKGRTVYVHVPAEQVAAVVKAARDVAINVRNRTSPEARREAVLAYMEAEASTLRHWHTYGPYKDRSPDQVPPGVTCTNCSKEILDHLTVHNPPCCPGLCDVALT